MTISADLGFYLCVHFGEVRAADDRRSTRLNFFACFLQGLRNVRWIIRTMKRRERILCGKCRFTSCAFFEHQRAIFVDVSDGCLAVIKEPHDIVDDEFALMNLRELGTSRDDIERAG